MAEESQDLPVQLKMFSGLPYKVEKEYEEWQIFRRKMDYKVTLLDKYQNVSGGQVFLSIFFTETRIK